MRTLSSGLHEDPQVAFELNKKLEAKVDFLRKDGQRPFFGTHPTEARDDLALRLMAIPHVVTRVQVFG